MSDEIIESEPLLNVRVIPNILKNIMVNEVDAFECYVGKLFVSIDLLTVFFSTNNKTKAVRFCNEEMKKIKDMVALSKDTATENNISYYTFFSSLTVIKGNLVSLLDIQDPSSFNLENRILKSTEATVDKYIDEIASAIGIDSSKLKYEISINTIVLGNNAV